jgi:hypothetical protein
VSCMTPYYRPRAGCGGDFMDDNVQGERRVGS